MAEAKSGDTIKLGEGNYTLYGVSSTGHTKGKDLTFEGAGADKTSWRIGREVPNPDYGGERNGDYSFDGAGTDVQEHEAPFCREGSQLPGLHQD